MESYIKWWGIHPLPLSVSHGLRAFVPASCAETSVDKGVLDLGTCAESINEGRNLACQVLLQQHLVR